MINCEFSANSIATFSRSLKAGSVLNSSSREFCPRESSFRRRWKSCLPSGAALIERSNPRTDHFFKHRIDDTAVVQRVVKFEVRLHQVETDSSPQAVVHGQYA